MLAHLVGFLGDFDLAEEACQDAFTIAAERWPRTGVPTNPGAWLTVTARNRAIDRLRRARALADKIRQIESVHTQEADMPEEPAIRDERLELLFMCCHPALGTEAQVALTLRALGGLTTEEIARAFLVPTETMKRRLSRAKAKIKAAGVPFAVPDEHLLPDRLPAVLAVVYLVFNEGYRGRVDLTSDALRLGWLLAELMPDEPEAHGLLALMLMHDARAGARFSGGELVLLADQDRSVWDWAMIEEGQRRLTRAIALLGRGPYLLQAAIASLHLDDPVDWRQVARLYERLIEVSDSDVVRLNYAVALAEGGEPERALAMTEGLALPHYSYLHSTRGELLRRLGRAHEARAAFARALELTTSEPERRFLGRRLSDL